MRTPPPPLFSIMLPTHNRAELLGRALASVVAQQEPRWELLIVDDGSTDSTWPLLCDWRVREPRLRCWWQSNRGQSASRPVGQSASRNRMLQAAQAPWIVFLDSDDEF